MIKVHFVNIGHGNMTIVIFDDNTTMIYDCNINSSNENQTLDYLKRVMPKNSIDLFVNSHRDNDHLSGIKTLNKNYRIGTLWDSGVSGSNDDYDYKEYMELRRSLGDKVHEVIAGQWWKGRPNVRILNSKREKYSDDTNSQSIVMHIDESGSSVLLTGDTDARVWKNYIVPEYKDTLKCSILLGSHHGSNTFFDDINDNKYYYTQHMNLIDPAMTVLSVGDNSYGHPDKDALKFYEQKSTGSNQGNKIARTDINGNIFVELKGNGVWSMHYDQ